MSDKKEVTVVENELTLAKQATISITNQDIVNIGIAEVSRRLRERMNEVKAEIGELEKELSKLHDELKKAVDKEVRNDKAGFIDKLRKLLASEGLAVPDDTEELIDSLGISIVRLADGGYADARLSYRANSKKKHDRFGSFVNLDVQWHVPVSSLPDAVWISNKIDEYSKKLSELNELGADLRVKISDLPYYTQQLNAELSSIVIMNSEGGKELLDNIRKKLFTYIVKIPGLDADSKKK